MKRSLVLCLTTALLLSTAHRLPAPIAEESPTPAATAKPRPRPNPIPQATIKPKPTPLSWAGTWVSQHQLPMRLSQTGDHVSGTYDWSGGGVMDGTVSGNILSGTWTQKNGQGSFRLSLSSDGNSFSGTWTAAFGISGPWTGTRK